MRRVYSGAASLIVAATLLMTVVMATVTVEPQQPLYRGALDRRGLMAAPAVDYEPGSTPASHIFDITSFGAIADNATIAAARTNGRALFDAWEAAHNAANKSWEAPGVVLVPGGSGVFTFVPHAIIVGVDNVVMRIDGVLSLFSGDVNLWPNRSTTVAGIDLDINAPLEGEQTVLNAIDVRYSSNVTISGNGTIEGNGEHWWLDVLATGTRNNNRPQLIWTRSCIGFSVVGIALTNGPRYHIFTDDLLYGYMAHITIFVDVVLMNRVIERRLVGQLGVPADWRDVGPGAFDRWVLPGMLGAVALNTDGIDISGQNVLVEDCTIQNYDDAVCSKPMSGDGNLTKCTSNVLFENHRIHYGVGASVGSVTPHPSVSCIADVTYRNIDFSDSIKSIYVKPNPGTHGRGVIDRVTYENIFSTGAMMWTIWTSTQQQDQPGTNSTDTGCSFLYPLPGTRCPLQPLVPITNLKLRNVTGVDAALSPGVLRCSDEGPCTGWEWADVVVRSRSDWPAGADFLCHGLVNKSWTNVSPACSEEVPTRSASAAGAESAAATVVYRFFKRLLEAPNMVSIPQR